MLPAHATSVTDIICSFLRPPPMHAALKVKHRTPWSSLSVEVNVQTAPNVDVVAEVDDIAAATVEDEAETLTGDLLDATRDHHRTQHATRKEHWVADM